MARAVVEPDGRIRLPDDLPEGLRPAPGDELEVLSYPGALTLLRPGVEEIDPLEEYGEKFVEDLRTMVDEVKQAEPSRHLSTEEFLRSLDERLSSP
ncbi:MAG: hypothetical protein ACM3S1_15290 [Hyphomicrobiales bacterium]